MSEGILLAKVDRGTLLPEAERIARLQAALPQVEAAVAGETDSVALQATLACLLWETLAQSNWCGFYRRIGEALLAVGPYQGGMGCLRIAFNRGVCGACARTGETQLVPEVQAFPGHIACDDATRSELVIPVRIQGRLEAVLDLDCPHPAGFCAEEARLLEGLLARVFDGLPRA
ncbi:MAG TPA: GAF domain-containing protein [Holophagaceae bacterium]